MKTQSPEHDYLLLYRLLMLIGTPMVFFDSFFFDALQPVNSAAEVVSRYVAALLVIASFTASWFSRWWQDNIGEITLFTSYCVVINAALILYDSKIGAYESYYPIGTLLLIGMTFHKTSLVFAFEIPAAIIYIYTAHQIPDPKMDPKLFTALVVVFFTYSIFLAGILSACAESELSPKLWQTFGSIREPTGCCMATLA